MLIDSFSSKINLDKIMQLNVSNFDHMESILSCLSYKSHIKMSIFVASQLMEYLTISHTIRTLDAIKDIELFLNGSIHKNSCIDMIKQYAVFLDSTFLLDILHFDEKRPHHSAFRIVFEMGTHVRFALDSHGVESTYDIKRTYISYLRNLILESLDDEEKENWLLIANI